LGQVEQATYIDALLPAAKMVAGVSRVGADSDGIKKKRNILTLKLLRCWKKAENELSTMTTFQPWRYKEV
jgi:hypothetical protein